jgi:hypothetical protein
MSVGVYATSLTIGHLGIGCFHATASITRYLGSDDSLRSGFNCHNIFSQFWPQALTHNRYRRVFRLDCSIAWNGRETCGPEHEAGRGVVLLQSPFAKLGRIVY